MKKLPIRYYSIKYFIIFFLLLFFIIGLCKNIFAAPCVPAGNNFVLRYGSSFDFPSVDFFGLSAHTVVWDRNDVCNYPGYVYCAKADFLTMDASCSLPASGTLEYLGPSIIFNLFDSRVHCWVDSGITGSGVPYSNHFCYTSAIYGAGSYELCQIQSCPNGMHLDSNCTCVPDVCNGLVCTSIVGQVVNPDTCMCECPPVDLACCPSGSGYDPHICGCAIYGTHSIVPSLPYLVCPAGYSHKLLSGETESCICQMQGSISEGLNSENFGSKKIGLKAIGKGGYEKR